MDSMTWHKVGETHECYLGSLLIGSVRRGGPGEAPRGYCVWSYQPLGGFATKNGMASTRKKGREAVEEAHRKTLHEARPACIEREIDSAVVHLWTSDKTKKSPAEVAVMLTGDARRLIDRMEYEIELLCIPGFPDLREDHVRTVAILAGHLAKTGAKIADFAARSYHPSEEPKA